MSELPDSLLIQILQSLVRNATRQQSDLAQDYDLNGDGMIESTEWMKVNAAKQSGEEDKGMRGLDCLRFPCQVSRHWYREISNFLLFKIFKAQTVTRRYLQVTHLGSDDKMAPQVDEIAPRLLLPRTINTHTHDAAPIILALTLTLTLALSLTLTTTVNLNANPP